MTYSREGWNLGFFKEIQIQEEPIKTYDINYCTPPY